MLQVDVHAPEVAEQVDSQLCSVAGGVLDVRQPNVVHPHFQRVTGHDAGGSRAKRIHAYDAHRQFLHCCQIRRRNCRIDRICHVAVSARGEAPRDLRARKRTLGDQCGVRTGARHGARAVLQPGVLQFRAQCLQLFEVHDDFWKPRRLSLTRVHRRAVQIEIVRVAPDLQEELQVTALSPSVAATARPRSHFLVLLEVPGALGETIVRLGTLILADGRREQAHRVLVDHHAGGFQSREFLVGLVDGSRR